MHALFLKKNNEKHDVTPPEGEEMVYFNNAATTIKKPDSVVKAVAEAISGMGNCGRGANGTSLEAARTIYEAREKIAELFGCSSPERVCFTSNATEALNTALFGLFGAGDHIISTDLEHNSVLRPLYELERMGAEVEFLNADKEGNIDYAEAEAKIKDSTRAIVCTHASNLTGNLVDIRKIGDMARKHGILFILDAAQSAGSFPINMEECSISVLCFTGHKAIMGVQGTGGLCVSKGVEIRPLKMGGTGVQTYLDRQPREYPTRLEAGTLNGPGIAGLLAAVDYIKSIGIDVIHKKEYELMKRFYDGVRDIGKIEVYGDFSGDRAPIVAINVDGYDSGEVSDMLSSEYGIETRAGAHCAPRMHRALGTEKCGAVRFSFGWFNDEKEVDYAICAIRRISDEG